MQFSETEGLLLDVELQYTYIARYIVLRPIPNLKRIRDF
jgi:hypothetical protein